VSADAPKGHAEASPKVVTIPQPGSIGAASDSSLSEPDHGVDASQSEVGAQARTEDEHLNTDERDKGEWDSRYPPKAQRAIRVDAAYVAAVFGLTLVAVLLTWRGSAFQWLAGDCEDCSRATFDRYAYFYLGGQLGGTLFGVKYLYNVVARGWWNIDRRLWRLFSPFLSAGLALAVGALIDSGVFGLTTKASSGASYFSLGFVAGYFADSALRKMKEIADTVFGSPEGQSGHSPKPAKK
jgi:hypothetical protein